MFGDKLKGDLSRCNCVALTAVCPDGDPNKPRRVSTPLNQVQILGHTIKDGQYVIDISYLCSPECGKHHHAQLVIGQPKGS